MAFVAYFVDHHDTQEMYNYLETLFGDKGRVGDGEDGGGLKWYLDRNYDRPLGEPHLELHLPGDALSDPKYALLAMQYPFEIIQHTSDVALAEL